MNCERLLLTLLLVGVICGLIVADRIENRLKRVEQAVRIAE